MNEGIYYILGLLFIFITEITIEKYTNRLFVRIIAGSLIIVSGYLIASILRLLIPAQLSFINVIVIILSILLSLIYFQTDRTKNNGEAL